MVVAILSLINYVKRFELYKAIALYNNCTCFIRLLHSIIIIHIHVCVYIYVYIYIYIYIQTCILLTVTV